MKKLLLLLLVLPLTANAADMCVKDDTLFVVFDPNVIATSTSYDTDSRTWSASFSYGEISGIAGCGRYQDIGGSIGTASTNQGAVDINGTEAIGVICACKMLSPVETYWVNAVYLSSTFGVPCWQVCAEQCATAMASSSVVVRQSIFGNVIE